MLLGGVAGPAGIPAARWWGNLQKGPPPRVSGAPLRYGASGAMLTPLRNQKGSLPFRVGRKEKRSGGGRSDHGGFSLPESSFEGSRLGRSRPAKLSELPGERP